MLTFGADPEVFSTYKRNSKDYVISPALIERDLGIEPVIQNNKHPIYIKNKEYSWMMDGVAWELTLLKPYESADSMFKSIEESLEELKNLFSKLEYPNLGKVNLYKRPVVYIDPELYLERLEDDKIFQGFIFGCDADFDAIETEYKCNTFSVKDHIFRYGGGHFHTGSDNNDDIELMHNFYVPFVQLLAITVGNIAISNSKYPEEEKLRSFHYGKPGRYRLQRWGIEYRTPSNSWIENKSTLELMMEGAKRAFYLLQNPQEGKEVINKYLSSTIESIKNSNLDLAKEIISGVLT